MMIELLGAAIYRWRGMDNPHPIPELIFCVPFSVIAGLYWLDLGWICILVGLCVLGLMTLICVTGHGRALGIDGPITGEPERLEFFTSWLIPYINSNAYKVTLMSFKGFLMMVPFAVATMNPLALLAGASIGLAYYLSYKTHAGSMGGELLTGAILWGAL